MMLQCIRWPLIVDPKYRDITTLQSRLPGTEGVLRCLAGVTTLLKISCLQERRRLGDLLSETDK